MADVLISTTLPARVLLDDGEDFAVTVAASAAAQVRLADVGVQGPPGPPGPPGSGSGTITGGTGIELVGADIRLNIDELPFG